MTNHETNDYEVFEAWMIGHKVEVTGYEKGEAGNPEEVIGSDAGTLVGFRTHIDEDGAEVGFYLTGRESAIRVPSHISYRILVVE